MNLTTILLFCITGNVGNLDPTLILLYFPKIQREPLVDHLSLIVIDAINRCWKPRFLYVTLAMVTLHLDRYMLMMGVMVVMACSPTHTDGAHTLARALNGFVDDVEMDEIHGTLVMVDEPSHLFGALTRIKDIIMPHVTVIIPP